MAVSVATGILTITGSPRGNRYTGVGGWPLALFLPAIPKQDGSRTSLQKPSVCLMHTGWEMSLTFRGHQPRRMPFAWMHRQGITKTPFYFLSGTGKRGAPESQLLMAVSFL